jgi:hypothetical protein
VPRDTAAYKVCAVNAAGEIGCPPFSQRAASVTVAGDRVKPVVALTAPGDGATVSGTVRLAADASDDVALAGVDFYIDGRHLAPTRTAAPFTADLDAVPLANGEHTVRVVATDWEWSQSSHQARVVIANPLSASLVAGYGFEQGTTGTAVDGSGRGNAGNVLGPTWTATGRFGGALTFDGANDRVDLPALGTFYQHGFTLEAWVKKAGVKRDVAAVGGWSGATLGGPMLWVDSLTGHWTGTLAKGAASYLNSGYAAVAGAWQHVAVTYDGASTVARFYLDGVEVASRGHDQDAMGATNLWRIGAYGDKPVGYFDGALDEIRIYRRALTAAEVAADMATSVEGVPATPAPAPPSAPANLTATGSVTKATLSWDAAAGAALYDVHRSRTPGFAPDAANRVARVTATSYTDAGLEPGTYHYLVRARNAFGDAGPVSNEATAEDSAEAPDVSAPEVALERPLAGSVARGFTVLQASATDDVGVASVLFLVDDVGFTGYRSGDKYVASWDATTVPNGDHRVLAVARDAAGNETRTAEVGFTVDNVPAPPGAVAAYGFDDGSGATAADSSGRGRHGSVQGGAAWTDAGKRGGALTFDGIDDRVDLGYFGGFFHDGFTLEAWVKKTTPKTDTAIVGNWLSGPGGGPMIWVDHLAGRYHLTTERSLAGYLDSGRTPAIGEWQHVAATYDGTTARIFIDGVEAASKVADTLGLGSMWRIGAYGNGHNGYFAGVIDDVRIYSRPLTAAEIRADRDGTDGEPSPPDTTAPTMPTALAVARATA